MSLPWGFEKAVGERTYGTELTVLTWAPVGMGKGSNQLSLMALSMAPEPSEAPERRRRSGRSHTAGSFRSVSGRAQGSISPTVGCL